MKSLQNKTFGLLLFQRRDAITSLCALLFPLLFFSCNQNGNVNVPDTSADSIKASQQVSTADEEKENEAQFPEETAELTDSVQTKGDWVVFFMQNGEWVNEIGAEEVANDFSFYASDAIDSLKAKGFRASFLIGDTIRIGLENGKTFKINNPACVMGVLMVRAGKEPSLKCGKESTENFHQYFTGYYN